MYDEEGGENREGDEGDANDNWQVQRMYIWETLSYRWRRGCGSTRISNECNLRFCGGQFSVHNAQDISALLGFSCHSCRL